MQRTTAKPNTPTNKILSEEDYLRQGHVEFMKRYAERFIQASRLMLRDRLVVQRHDEDVEKFKSNLGHLITKFEGIKNSEDYSQVVEEFGKLNDFYNEMPLEKQTAETQFIKEILKQYECDKIVAEVKEIMSEFMASFVQALMG